MAGPGRGGLWWWRDRTRAAFPVGGIERGGVSLTLQVPAGFFGEIDGGGASATLLLTPQEARGFAAWLDAAAESADAVGPPLYE